MHALILGVIIVVFLIAMSVLGIAVVEGGDRTLMVVWKGEVLPLYTTWEIQEFLGAFKGSFLMRRGPIAIARDDQVRILRQSELAASLSPEELTAVNRYVSGRDQSGRALRCVIIHDSHPVAAAAETLSRKYAAQESYARSRREDDGEPNPRREDSPIIIVP